MTTSPLIIIYRLNEDAPVRLAARELARCLRRMTGAGVAIRRAVSLRSSAAAIFVGLPGSADILSASSKSNADNMSALPVPNDWDDALCITSFGDSLLLSGANPRSVLFAVYRWLEALGARWVRPGADGEYLPAIPPLELRGWNITEQAANRHRGIVIEGTNFIEQVLEVVEWMPKLRMNAYMLQFRVSATFWRRWYERTDLRAIRNPRLLSLEECAALDARVTHAVLKRGMLLHRVGHGWTCEALGHHGSGWETAASAPAELRPLLAEVNGVRDWHDGIPLNTELCYSNPEARERFIAEVLTYARAHPEVDVLHIWASDGVNNHCECPNCAALQPADWYISLLNELSPRLAEIAPRMRIVALCYTNTMWPPAQVPPAGLGKNLIFMFAPITRCYAHSILDHGCTSEMPLQPFLCNQVQFPRANSDYAVMLRAWQQYLPAGTDAFVFDYHFWCALPNDLLGSNFAHMLRDDVREYHSAGVNGLLSCQLQRTSLPTALPQIAMAAYLWDASRTTSEVEEEYFPAAFGPAANVARDFLTAFTTATGASAHLAPWWEGITLQKARAVRRVLRQAAPLLRQALADSPHPVWRRSLFLLRYYLRYQQLVWRALVARVNGHPAAPALLQRAIDFLTDTEPQVYRWLDTSYWKGNLEAIRKSWESD